MKIRTYVAVAAAIAATAFGIGQVWPGMGVPFVGLATTFWTAFAVRHEQKRRANHG